MNNLKMFEKIFETDLSFLNQKDRKRIKQLIIENNLIENLFSSQSYLIPHLRTIARESIKFFNEYTEDLNLDNKNYMRGIVILASIFHDMGKLNLFRSLINEDIKYDSVEIELILRKYKLNEIAQAVRHNPFLFLFDLHNGLLTIPQLIVAYTDMRVDREGNIVTPLERLDKILLYKKINGKFQGSFYEVVDRLFKNRVIKTPHSSLKISFFERCDGRYPVTNDLSKLGKLSSYHIAVEMVKLGYEVSIFTENPNHFTREGVRFFGIGNDLLESFRVAKNFDLTFITGWTSLFEKLKKTKNNLPLIVMRSLKFESLTQNRINTLLKNPDRVILVSKQSNIYLNSITKKQKNYRIIGNGVNKDTFYYLKSSIKKQFLFVGAPIKEKGIDFVLDLATKMKDYKCYIIGSEKMYGREEEISKVSKLENVVFLGEIPQTEISKYYTESMFSVFFTNPKLIFETFGKSAAESQLCGCPVIYIKNGGLSTTICDNSLNIGIDEYLSNSIVSIIKENEKEFKDHSKREWLAELSAGSIMSWEDTALNYLLLGNIELIKSLRNLIKNKRDINKYLYD